MPNQPTRYSFAHVRADGTSRRQFGISRLGLAILSAGMVVLAGLSGLLVGGSEEARLAALQAENEALRLENESYLQATRQLTDQIANLQSAITELSTLAELDPATRRAIDRLPAIVRARAMGGDVAVPAARTAAQVSPERTFSRLQLVLEGLESGLGSLRVRFENQQALARATPTLWPTVGWLSSAFGSRKDPFTGHPDFHAGLDISADRGTPVRAPADGTVDFAGSRGNYGKSVLLDHGYGLSTRYAHLSTYIVRPGQTVRRGDLLGYVGSTGRATSSHLHYEVLLSGSPINPLRLLTRP
ncbi:MAG TPA: M23 family metallopeptidase [Vicinamibacterales bacterium]|nr:M23 family metallopeptidase [Vicinamibacterales bacterium]